MTSKADETIEDMAAAGAFGTDSRVVSFKVEGLHTESDQFASCVVYGVATVDNRDGRRHDHRLVLKYKQPTAELREFCNNDRQFYNEILFYERIAPFLLDRGSRRDGTGTPNLCRYFYGRNGCGEDGHRDVVVLGNATVDGYRTAATGHKLSLDFDHLAVALRTLAKFHGLSYRAKREDLMKFKEIINEVKETSFSENGEWIFHSSVLQGLFALALNWLKERHVENGGSDCDDNVVKMIRQFESELMDEPIEKLKHIVAPIEPLAVLCHGDFNRNNILFRYDDSGRPVDSLPYDMATIRYGSPAIDLSFFLYMNADRQTRNDHWDALLDMYCSTLADEAGDVPVPNRNQIDAEMRECGFSGLVHVSFFARVMLEENLMPDSSDFVNADDSKFLEILSLNGGDLATEWVADALHHFFRIKYAKTPNTTTNKVNTPIKYHE